MYEGEIELKQFVVPPPLTIGQCQIAERPVLHTDSSSHDQLTPGTYHTSSLSSSSSFSAPLDQTTSSSGDTITLNFPSLPFAFPSSAYRGSPNGFSGINWTADAWESLYLPQGWYAVVGDGQVLWGPVVDSGHLPGGVQKRVKKASSCKYCTLYH